MHYDIFSNNMSLILKIIKFQIFLYAVKKKAFFEPA